MLEILKSFTNFESTYLITLSLSLLSDWLMYHFQDQGHCCCMLARYIDTILILAGESRESYKYFTVVFESVSISPRVVGQMKRGISLE